jgi:DNA-binding LacI/PurR family transcriptional regulator
VIGFDEVTLTTVSGPSLTKVCQQLEAMRNLAANMVNVGVKAS